MKDHQRKFPYGLMRDEKDELLTARLKELTLHHMACCPEYARMVNALGINPEAISDYRELPPLPAGLFKRLTLSSLPEGYKYKMLTSSGTTGQQRSVVVLDGNTRTAQQRALAAIGADFLGESRLPMLVIDRPSTVKDRNNYSARSAAITGFSLFGAHRTFALTEEMEPDMQVIEEFLGQYGNELFLIFGFTFIIWESFCCWLEKYGIDADMSNAILIHGGGWKKLADLHITRNQFKDKLKSVCGITRVHDYYGMAEQAGSIFMECEEGHYHCSDFSGVVIRRVSDFSSCAIGEKGLINVYSTIPESYPGHSILTEDYGVLLGEDDCPCKRAGVYFDVTGRAEKAEIRGCSDTYEKV